MEKYNPYIISIAGDSGSGKSTISNFIRLYYGYESCTLISGDDLHNWERGDSNWENITHLNPNANNLKLGDLQLLSLKEGVKILRKKYNHYTGKFNELESVLPNKYIINEGLHAFYTADAEVLSDLKIYIDIEEDFRIDLKIKRDTVERGYKKDDVIDLIEKRKKDSENIKKIQLEKADVIIKIKRGNDIEIQCKSDVDYLLFDFIKKLHKELYQFEWINKTIGDSLPLVQSKGGNISVKIFDKLIIKSSGERIKDVSYSNGYSILNYKTLNINNIQNDLELHDELVNSVKDSIYKKPSMETGFHTIFKKYVFHLHPIYLNCILCLENSEQIIKRLFDGILEYDFIEYHSPGYNLTKKVLEKENIKDIVFLQNHGLIISSNDYHDAIYYITLINKTAKYYIKENVKIFEQFSIDWYYRKNVELYSWPDSVILSDFETIAANNYINTICEQIGVIKKLKKEDIEYLKNMDSEKYRL